MFGDGPVRTAVRLPTYRKKTKRQAFDWTQCYWSLIVCRTSQEDQKSDDIDTNHSYLQSQRSCSWPVPFFSCFSFVLECWLWSFLIRRRSKLKNSSTKWQSPWKIVELHRTIILSLPTELIEHSVLTIYSDSCEVCLFISPLVPLRPLVGLRPFSNAVIISFRLTMACCISACCCSEHNSRRRSLSLRVLSHSDTHYLNRHLVGCGCHEI